MKGVPSPSLLGFWPCSSVSPAPLLPSPLSLAGPSPSPAPSALSSPPAWHSLCCGRAQQLPALAWQMGVPVGQGKLASGISRACGQQEVCPWRGEPCSWPQASYSARPKFRGGAWGLPLISTLQVRGSGLRGPESNRRSGWGPDGGTGGRWGRPASPQAGFGPPGCGAVGRGLSGSLSRLVVCARRVWPGHRALIRGCSSAAPALWAPEWPGAERVRAESTPCLSWS